MSNDEADAIARRVAGRLADLHPNLPDEVDQALAEDPLALPTDRLIDPVSLAALIVSIASLGWTIYHDTKKDRAAAGLDRAAEAQHLKAHLLADDTAARLPPDVTFQQRDMIIGIIASEITAADGAG